MEKDHDGKEQSYSALYWMKRHHKVIHKSKGVSKFDGILSVSISTGLVSLREIPDENDKDPSSTSDSLGSSWISQKRKAMTFRDSSSDPISSSSSKRMLLLHEVSNANLARQISAFHKDDLLFDLGPWQVQLIAELNESHKEVVPSFLPMMSAPLNRIRSFKRSVAGAAGARSAETTSTCISIVPSSIRHAMLRRQPTTKMMSAEATFTSSGAMQDPSLLASSSFSRRPSLSSQHPPLPLPSKTTTPSSSLPSLPEHDFFPGAIIPIPAPMSIKNILKPHQIKGVVFLWNVLTGSCPNLQRILGPTRNDNYHHENHPHLRRGAILADEMGLGKTLMTIAIIISLHRRNRLLKYIVICPSSLVSNWAQEFDKFIGKASQPHRVIVRKGGEEGLQMLKSFVGGKKSEGE